MALDYLFLRVKRCTVAVAACLDAPCGGHCLLKKKMRNYYIHFVGFIAETVAAGSMDFVTVDRDVPLREACYQAEVEATATTIATKNLLDYGATIG